MPNENEGNSYIRRGRENETMIAQMNPSENAIKILFSPSRLHAGQENYAALASKSCKPGQVLAALNASLIGSKPTAPAHKRPTVTCVPYHNHPRDGHHQHETRINNQDGAIIEHWRPH